MASLQFEVSHYGEIIDDYETVAGINALRQKVYRYENELYVETWCNGELLMFVKL